jgi:hypothetical protein
MKKLLLVLAIGSLFAVACNDGGSAEAEKTAADSAATQTVDTPATQPTADTTVHAVDTTKKADTTIKK